MSKSLHYIRFYGLKNKGATEGASEAASECASEGGTKSGKLVLLEFLIKHNQILLPHLDFIRSYLNFLFVIIPYLYLTYYCIFTHTVKILKPTIILSIIAILYLEYHKLCVILHLEVLELV